MNTFLVSKDKLQILIVDDNIGFVERMIGLLDEVKNIGYISVAADFEEGHRMLNEDRPDLVLLDINLPGKSGIELLKKIKNGGHNSTVIMLTNHADDYYREQCKVFGADHFLDKSRDFGKVPGIISTMYN